jgi:hypothetical protein
MDDNSPAYVEVIGSQDASFVGPFADLAAATAFADRERKARPQFDFSPMTEAQRQASIAQYGDIPLTDPGVFDDE